ncbi:MAG: hypothetical protein IH897_12350 [Planctomycetes bacterium]|nr:hypothetical protein [Planctomycetota bacterium]
MRNGPFVWVGAWLAAVAPSFADDTIYRYEGNVVPYDESAGWLDGLCEKPCSESIEDGHFVLRWPFAADSVNYFYRIAVQGEAPPPTLWVEWRFRSNHPLGPNFFTCDAWFTVIYKSIVERMWMYGDAAISFGGNAFVPGLTIDEFHTYRFESLDGAAFQMSVDGRLFITGVDGGENDVHTLKMGGLGGCKSDQIPDMINEWDFVRYGTIAFGEKVIASDPPQGLVDARKPLDRFTVTFDSANYVYIDDILVETTADESPVVLMTRRRENDEPDTVEIVLDRPIAFGETTRFTMTDAGPPPIDGVNTIEYHFATGDFDNSGSVALTDHAQLANCLKGPTRQSISRACTAFDFTADKAIDLWDFAFFQTVFTGETP